MSTRLVVISGPSGVGKSTLVARLRADPRVYWSVSATTRPARAHERDGVDYHFLSEEQFAAEADRGGFLEHAWVHGQRYGTLRAPLEQALRGGQLPLLDVDTQGAKSLMACGQPVLTVFILPPSMDALVARLSQRGSESAKRITQRLSRVNDEIAMASCYDHRIVNDELERALAELVDVIAQGTRIRLQPGPPDPEDP